MPHTQVCPRSPVAKLGGLIPLKWIERLEQDQTLPHCCRHPEHHEIEALKSKDTEKAPDIYIFHCTCGARHIRFMAGGGDMRPTWEVR